MCGICGEVGWDETAPVDKDLLVAMMRSMAHRGPDGEGLYLDPSCKVGLGHRRLSIIDIEGGHQPLSNEDGSIHVIFNGEIYNFQELRHHLEAHGHQFKTRSDTEVLVHLYEQEGTEMLHALKGMFAFCIYDERQKLAFLARDRFGEKPLYYYLANETLYFSSEIVGLTCRPNIPRRLNWEGLAYYMRYGCSPSPITLFEGIYSLEPGCAMVYHRGKTRVWQYFQIDFSPRPELSDPGIAQEQILAALHKSAHRQKVSDVPIGVFLSGGIDSSTVAALMRDELGPGFRTFNVRFTERSYDEGPIAQRVADKLGTTHIAMKAVDQQFEESDFWRIIAHVGEPFTDSTAIPCAIMCQRAREHVKVCLSGDGGDEVFAGYTVFGRGLHAHQLSNLPRILATFGRIPVSLATRLPWLRNQPALRRLRKGLSVLSVPWNQAFAKLHESLSPAQLARLVQNDARGCLELPVEDRLAQFPAHVLKWTPLRQMMYWRLRYVLASDMLTMVDRMAMAHSLEVRAPFLDPDLFSTAAGLPDNLLWRNGCGKWIIRKALKDKLPAAVFDHPKTGFMIPLHRMQNENYRRLTAELFSTESFRSIFKPDAVERIRNCALELRQDNAQTSLFISSHRLWVLAQLAGWLQYFDVSVG